MKTILLLIATLFCLPLFAQTTHHLNWHLNFTSPATDLSISVGDTVIWTWTDTAPHTVESATGSTETFSSAVLSGIGQTYSHTFTSLGVNPYLCGIHGAASMSGTITVQVLGTNETTAEDFLMIYPNPTTNFLQISKIKNTIKSVLVYDAAGRKIKSYTKFDVQKNSKLDVSSLENGTYFIEIQTEGKLVRKQFIKK